MCEYRENLATSVLLTFRNTVGSTSKPTFRLLRIFPYVCETFIYMFGHFITTTKLSK
jgi:hypothetical protein